MMATLYRCTRDGIALTDCLATSFVDRSLTGFCQSPRALYFATWDGNSVHTGTGADIGQVYEARFFDTEGELRWLRDPQTDGLGRAAWVSESDSVPVEFAAIDPLPDVEPLNELLGGSLPHRYAMQTRAQVPGALQGRRCAYRVREYLGAAPGTAGEDGNLVVVEQRITDIEFISKGEPA